VAGMCSVLLLLLHRLRPVGSQQISFGAVLGPAAAARGPAPDPAL